MLRVEMTLRCIDIWIVQNHGQVYRVCTADAHVLAALQLVAAADHLVDGAEAQTSHDFTQLAGDEQHVVLYVLWLALEARAQLRVLGRNAHRAGVQIAHAHHRAAHSNQRAGGKAKFLCAEQAGDGNIAAGHQLGVSLNDNAGTQTVLNQSLMGFCNAQLPRQTGIVNRALRRCTGTAVIAGNQDDLCAALGNACGNRADTGFGYQLDVDARLSVGVLQVVNQLCQILDGINIMMRRRRNQRHARRGETRLGNPRVNLLARQVAAFARLCALCHLDLDLVAAHQVLRVDAETAGCNLYDGACALCAVAVGRLAALTGVGVAAQTVHGDGETLMCLCGQTAVGHGCGLEALDNLIFALDFLNRNCRALVKLEAHQTAQRVRDGCIVDGLCILLVNAVVAGANSLLQQRNGLWIVQMIFTADACAVLVRAGGVERGVNGQTQRVKRMVVAEFDNLADFLQTDAADAGNGVGEVLVNDLLLDADCLENLCGLIGLDGRDTHLRCNLDDALEHSLVVRVDGNRNFLVEQTLFNQLCNALLCQIRVDSGCTVAEQRSEMMHLARLCGLHDDGKGGALFGAHQILLQGRDSEQGRNRNMVLVYAAVGQNQDVCAVAVCAVCGHKHAVNGALEWGVFIIQHGNRLNLKARLIHVFDLHQVDVGQNRVLNAQHAAIFCIFAEQVAVMAEIYGGIRDNFLADGVNRRVGNLCEQLLEVAEQRLMLLGQHGERNVDAHCGGRLCAGLCHLQNRILDFLVGVAERLVQAVALLAGIAADVMVRNRQILEHEQALIQPLAVRLTGCILLLQLVIVNQTTGNRIDQQHLARLQAGLDGNLFRL